MRTTAILLVIGLMAAIPLLGFTEAMNGPGGPQNSPASGGGPRWDDEEMGSDLGHGMMHRSQTGSPNIGITDGKGNGLSMWIENISYTCNGTTRSIRPMNGSWDMATGPGPDGGIVEDYRLNASLAGSELTMISFRYTVQWNESGGHLQYNLNLDPLPENGTLKVWYMFRLEGDRRLGSFMDEGKGISLRSGDGSILGHLDHSDSLADPGQEVDLSVDWYANETEASVEAIAQIGSGSVELEGSVTLFDSYLAALRDLTEDAVDYLVDHLVSFSVGAALGVALTVSAIAVLGRKRRDPQDGLILEKNRYYRG